MLSCFQKSDLGDIIHFESGGDHREYLVITPFDGYKVKTINMQTYRVDDICVADIRFLKKIIKANTHII